MSGTRGEQHAPHGGRRADLLFAALVVMLGALLTGPLWWSLEHRAEQLEQQGFTAHADRIENRLHLAAEQYLGEIHDLASFAGTHDPPSNEHLVRFAEESGVFDLSTTQVILYVEKVPQDDVGAVVARERAAGDDDFLPITTRFGSGEPLYLLTRAGTAEGAPAWMRPLDFGSLGAGAAVLAEAERTGRPVLVDFGLVFGEVFRAGGLVDQLGLDSEVLRNEVLTGLGEDADGPEGLALAVPVGSLHDPDEVAAWVVVGMLPRDRIAPIQDLAGPQTTIDVVIVPEPDVELSDDPETLLFEGRPGGPDEAPHTTVRTVEVEGLTWQVSVRGWGLYGADSAYDLADLALVAGLVLSVMIAVLVYVRARFARRTGEVLEQLDRTEHRAFHDELTGLLNRAGLTEELRRLVQHDPSGAGTCAVLFIDVDRLKVINDSLGHSVGDLALREVARRFEAAARGHDRLARFGGDEFVVVCRDVDDLAAAVDIARRMLATFDAPILVGDAELVLSASVGIALTTPGSAADAETLLRDADAAMYRAKAKGGSSVVVFDESLRHDATDRLELESGLRQALDAGQIEVYLQPIADITSLDIVGYEALVRWQHPRDGLVEPPRFLPVAEETGLIVPVGHRVIALAARAAAALREAGVAEPRVAVNLSERQLLDSALQENLRAAAERHGLAPRHLAIEVTEEVVIDRRGRVQGVLRALRERGHSISIDDFGTGVSSLAALRSLDMVDTVKIDRAFLASIDRDPTDRAIVKAIVAMAEALGIRLVAEGVERSSQLEVLRDLGVHTVQGYAIGRPRPVEVAVGERRAVLVPSEVSPAAPAWGGPPR